MTATSRKSFIPPNLSLDRCSPKQPVEVAKWHALTRTNQQTALIPKLG